MTIQERQGALWALQTVAASRYVREVTKVAMHIHVHPRITSDAIKALFWPDDYQFTVWLLPKSLRKRYACASCFYGMTWDSWKDTLINDAQSLVDALTDDDFNRVHAIMRRDRISSAYRKTPH